MLFRLFHRSNVENAGMLAAVKPFTFAAIMVSALAGGAPLAARSSDPAPSAAAGQPAQLVAFDIRRFFTRAMQLGLTTQSLEYAVTVGPDGKAGDCAFARPFRSAFVDREMCRQLRQVATFRPALDAAGNPVASRYSGTVTIISVFTPDR